MQQSPSEIPEKSKLSTVDGATCASWRHSLLGGAIWWRLSECRSWSPLSSPPELLVLRRFWEDDILTLGYEGDVMRCSEKSKCHKYFNKTFVKYNNPFKNILPLVSISTI